MLENTKDVVTAQAMGNILKSKEGVVVGDIVELQKSASGAYEIHEIHPRKNSIFRHLVRNKKKKIIASNIDVIVIVVAASLPEYKRGLVDRYLVRAVQWEIDAVLVFNKMDEKSPELDIQFEADRVKELGVEAYEISATDDHYRNQLLSLGLKDLKNYLSHKTAIFLGQSGVGKSKLITSLTDHKFEILSGDLAKVGKGAHTTTWAEIIECGDFQFVDSPGVRAMSLEDITHEEIIQLFPDLYPIAKNCKFTNCPHTENIKGCAFHMLDKSQRQNQLLLTRLDSLIRLTEEIKAIPDWQRE